MVSISELFRASRWAALAGVRPSQCPSLLHPQQWGAACAVLVLLRCGQREQLAAERALALWVPCRIKPMLDASTSAFVQAEGTSMIKVVLQGHVLHAPLLQAAFKGIA